MHKQNKMILNATVCLRNVCNPPRCGTKQKTCLPYPLHFQIYSPSYPLYLAPVPLFGRKWCSFIKWMHWKLLGVITGEYLCHKVTIGKIPGNEKQGKQTEYSLNRRNPLWTSCCLGSIREQWCFSICHRKSVHHLSSAVFVILDCSPL